MKQNERYKQLRLSGGSLRVQMAVGSALIALAAVVLVTLSAAISISLSFGQYRRNQLSTEVRQLASLVTRRAGEVSVQGTTSTGGDLAASIPLLIRPTKGSQFQQENMWAMDPQGKILVAPQTGSRGGEVAPADAGEIANALKQALGGHSTAGSLSHPAIPWLSQRFFAAAPVRLGESATAPIIGAVALSSLPRADLGVAFSSGVITTLFLAGLATALLAALGATVFSRRLVRPLDHLAAATTRMTGGDYSVRVDISAPNELRRLANTFNEMAASLESDVSELHRQEKLRRDLVANISHELATPLTAIQGYTEALADGVIHDPAGREESTRMIAREAARLRRLVDQLRQVSLFEAGAERLEYSPLQLQSVVTDTLEVLAPALERKQVTVRNEISSELPEVNADSDRLIEILLNLFDNAMRHTPEGGQIRVKAFQDGRFIRVSISDTGTGITADDSEHIFDRFYRVDASRSKETGGTGLGLSIVRALVEAHGGTIKAGSAQDGGAEFTFTLPLAVR
jgi:two-component system, OmpR family, sensor histidine kinase BaeS